MVKVLISMNLFPPDYTGAGKRILRFIERSKDVDNLSFLVLCLTTQRKKKIERHNNYEIWRIYTPASLRKIVPLYAIYLFVQINYFLIRNHKRIDILHFISFEWINRIIMISNMLLYDKKTILESTSDNVDDINGLLNNGFRNKLVRPLTKLLLSRISKFICSSEYSRKTAISFGINKSDIYFRPNPVDEKKFGTINVDLSNKIRNKLNLPLNKFIILHVGNIRPLKNQLFLLNVLDKIKELNVYMILIGPLPKSDSPWIKYYNSIRKFIELKKLESKVKILGYREKNINEYLIASDLFIFASVREGFPNSVAEAIYSGLPVISSNLSGIKIYNQIKYWIYC